MKVRTSITQIREDKQIAPKSPMWVIINDGSVNILINGTFAIAPGDRFGIDVHDMLLKDDRVEYDTSFNITFATNPDVDNLNTRSAQLIETVFIKENI